MADYSGKASNVSTHDKPVVHTSDFGHWQYQVSICHKQQVVSTGSRR